MVDFQCDILTIFKKVRGRGRGRFFKEGACFLFLLREGSLIRVRALIRAKALIRNVVYHSFIFSSAINFLFIIPDIYGSNLLSN